jgi:hypothetical protein
MSVVAGYSYDSKYQYYTDDALNAELNSLSSNFYSINDSVNNCYSQFGIHSATCDASAQAWNAYMFKWADFLNEQNIRQGRADRSAGPWSPPQYLDLSTAAPAPAPSPGPSPAPAPITTPTSAGTITVNVAAPVVNVAAPVVNFDTEQIVYNLHAMAVFQASNFLPSMYQLIDAVKGVSGGSPALDAMAKSMYDVDGTGFANNLAGINESMLRLQGLIATLAPIGAAFEPPGEGPLSGQSLGAAFYVTPEELKTLPPLARWFAQANTAAANDSRGKNRDAIHLVVDEIVSVMKDILVPLQNAFKDVVSPAMEVMHAPGQILGRELAGMIIGEVTGELNLVAGSTMETAEENARTLWSKMYGLGMSAHLFAEGVELIHPFKQLGVPQAAAFAVDLAGFGRVGASIMGALTDAGVGIPMRYAALREAQPEIPGFRQLATMFRRGSVHETWAKDSLQNHGYDESWADAFIESWYHAPSLYELSVLLQDSDVDSSVMHDMLKKNGYQTIDADNMIKGLEAKIVAPARTNLINAALALFEKGLMTEQELSGELASQNLRPNYIALLTQAGTLRGQAIIKAEATTEFNTMHANGQLDDASLATALTGLGYNQQRVDILVAVQSSKRKGKIATKASAGQEKIQAELQRESIILYREQFDAGLIDATGYQGSLVAVGLDPAVATAIANIDALKISQRTTAIKTAQAQVLHDKIIQETRVAMQDQYRKDLITLDQLTSGLNQLGLDPAIVNAVVAQEQALAQPKPSSLINPPQKLLVQVTTERLRRAVIEEFKKGKIDQAQAKEELVSSGEDPGLAAEDLRLAAAQSYRTPPAVPETPAEKQTRTARKDTAIVEYQSGAIDEATLGAELVAAGYDPALSDALVLLQVAKRQAKAATAAAKASAATVKKKPVGG